MDRIKVRNNLPITPLPCEWFDLIVGTSTGGLIALMVGRLRMSVDEAIAAYRGLAREVFTEDNRTLSDRINPLSSAPRYGAVKLEEAVKGFAGNALLAEDAEGALSDVRCRVAVVTVMQSAADLKPTLLRTYINNVTPPTCTIVEAARATSAATGFFPPAEVQMKANLSITYVDGGLSCNNPALLAAREARQIWDTTASSESVKLIVSIGTGVTPYVGFEGNLIELAQRLASLSTSSKQVDMQMREEFGNSQQEIYFRFNPPNDLARIGLDEWERLEEIAEIAYAYIHEIETEVNSCVAALTRAVGILLSENDVAGFADPDRNCSTGCISST